MLNACSLVVCVSFFPLIQSAAMSQLSSDDRKDEGLVRKTAEKARLSPKESEYEAQINRAVEEHSQEWEMDLQQVRSVLGLRGHKKLHAIAGTCQRSDTLHVGYTTFLCEWN